MEPSDELVEAAAHEMFDAMVYDDSGPLGTWDGCGEQDTWRLFASQVLTSLHDAGLIVDADALEQVGWHHGSAVTTEKAALERCRPDGDGWEPTYRMHNEDA